MASLSIFTLLICRNNHSTERAPHQFIPNHILHQTVMRLIQGVSSFLPPPNFPMCQNPAKITESWTGHHQKWQSPELATPKMTESRTLVCLGVVSSGLCHFLGMASSWLYHFWGWPVQDSVIFWILAHREIRGWQEGWNTL